jgi:hypothetical protein
MSGGLALAIPLAMPSTAGASTAYHYKNCTALHKDYKHGVGKTHAKDKVTVKSKPVTNFTHSTTKYKKIVAYNSDLDRDHDGVACEKR